jgi:ethanolamine utilization protein EutA
MSEDAGGRIFFSNIKRSLEVEDEIVLISVGVDIGSSTSHLVFSRLVMERLDNRYIVSERTVLHESDVLLTPYDENQTIDADRLGQFINAQYEEAGITPDKIDTGALILTGVAVRRSNARAIADLFAKEAGKFVSVSAGDALETTLAAFGSGAAALSIRTGQTVMNIDMGGGTTKFAVCRHGQVVDITALDVGARIVSFDDHGFVNRIEEAAKQLAREAHIDLVLGEPLSEGDRLKLVQLMAQRVLEVSHRLPSASLPDAAIALLRLDSMEYAHTPEILTFSGGVSEYIYDKQVNSFNDLGPDLAREVKRLVLEQWPSVEMLEPIQGIRATVVGASQYTVQVSGSTIFVEPKETLPLRNIAVIAPEMTLTSEILNPQVIAQAIRKSLRRLDLQDGGVVVAMFYEWGGSASYARLDAFCQGVQIGLDALISKKQPVVLVGEADCAGLIGIHCQQERHFGVPVISVDGVTLTELDYVDIGAMLETSGAVPVVIKSLVFPSSSGLGKSGFTLEAKGNESKS